jgi:hypothetical protein
MGNRRESRQSAVVFVGPGPPLFSLPPLWGKGRGWGDKHANNLMLLAN